MKAIKNYIRGIKEASFQPKMILTLWVINVLFASVLYFPLSGLIKDFIGNSAASEQLLSKWDNYIFFEWLIHTFSALQPVLLLIMIVVFLYGVFSLFLKGGILSIFAAGAGVSEKTEERWCARFFRGAGKYWWRFFRLCIYSLVLWTGFAIFIFILSEAGRLISNGGIREQAAFIWFIIEILIGLFLVLLILMILDYARIRIVAEATQKVFISLWKAAGFVFSHFGRTLALYYLLTATGAILFFVYWKLAGLIETHTAAGIWLAFGAGQVFIASREWLLMAFQAGQLNMYLKSKDNVKEPRRHRPVESPETAETEDFEFEKPSEKTWSMPLEETKEREE